MGFIRMAAMAAVLILPGLAFAQLAPNPTGRAALAAFKAADRDGDHGLSMAEMRGQGREKGADTLFILLDADGDGRLSLKELGRNGPALARFEAYDVNKDGFVARREFPNFPDPVLLLALDRDHDGRVGLNEFRATFAGSRAVAQVAEDAPAKRKPQPAKPVAYCWIPGFGDDQWMLEGPVLWTRCRTS